MVGIMLTVGYAMAVIVGLCVITLVVVLASPIVLIGGAAIGSIWLLYAGLVLISHAL